MKISYHKKFYEDLQNFPLSIKKKLKKQIGYLSSDIRHPSLHAKKFDKSLDIWQARVDKDIRFYFSIHNEMYFLLEIKKHPK